MYRADMVNFAKRTTGSLFARLPSNASPADEALAFSLRRMKGEG